MAGSRKWTEFIRAWCIPIISALLFCTGWALRMEANIETCKEGIEQANRRFDCLTRVDSDGVLDPEWHSKLDLHIRGVALTKEEFAAWRKLFHRLNPQVVTVNGD